MNLMLPVMIDLLLSFVIFFVAFQIYSVYRRKYMLWFLFALFFMPILFVYSWLEWKYLSAISPYAILIYPLIIIVVEIATIMAQKNLLKSLKMGEKVEYSLLLREDVALVRAFEKIANHLIGKISLFIGVKDVEDLLEECIEKYPILEGCYIDTNEYFKTDVMEENLGEMNYERMEELCKAFSYFLARLTDIQAALVPYGEIVEELKREVGKIDVKIVKYFVPFTLFKIVLEPIIREYKGEELKNIRMMVDVEGIYINRKGGIDYHRIYDYDIITREDKFVKFLERLLVSLGGSNEVRKRITDNLRKLPENVKEEIYRYEFIKKLPRGILDEEKIVLASKDRLIQELVEKKEKLEEAYSRLAQAKLDKMKSDFVNIMAHELKTPLTAIKTYTELMRKGKLGRITKLQKEKLDRMARNIERMTRLIDDMLQIPSIDARELELRKEIFSADEMIDEILAEVEEMAKEKGQEMEVDMEDDLTIFGDKNLIEKAIKNLVVNAIKYTPEKGKIMINGIRDGEYAHIIVKDTGKGIPPGEIERIFEPFYSREGGAGLGLAIAKNVVESHGGKIWAESDGRKGAAFHVMLRRRK